MANISKILFLTVLLGAAFSPYAYAQIGSDAAASANAAAAAGAGGGQVASQTCDTQVWQTMENRARMETEREIMQNQNLIFKPDSVLHYTCFDKFAAHASDNVGVLFTHTTYWDGKEIIKWGAPFGMDNAMTKVVINSMTPYSTSNFPHAYLGGRGDKDGLGLSTPQLMTQISHGGASYGCGVMAQVWTISKCMNFMHGPEAAKWDGFYPFKNLAPGPNGGQAIDGYEKKNDVRQYPTPCSGADPVPGKWAEFTNFSRNSDNGTTYNHYYDYSTPNLNAFTAVRKLVDPVGGAGGAATCGAAVKTGVKIILSPGEAATQEDGVCTNPGCTYTQGSCISASTAGGPIAAGGPAATH